MKNLFATRKTIAACLFVTLLTTSSCKKELNPDPESAFSTDYVFSTTTTALSAVLGVYNALTGDNSYGSRVSLYYSMDDDLMVGPANRSSGGGDNDRTSIARYNATSGNTQLEAPFNRLFAGVERANICIKNIPAMELYTKGSASEKAALQRMHGEVLALRAQFYFEIIRNWGDVPASFIPSADQPDLFLKKTDRDTIYNKIIEDLRVAADLVPWRTEVASDERLTKGAIKALRARLAMFRGGYSLRRESHLMERRADYLTYYAIAKQECADIMARRDQHDLNPSFKAVFKDALCAHKIEPTGEVMFEVAMAGGSSSTDGKFGYYDGNRMNGVGNRSITFIPSYFYMFDSLDLRRDVTGSMYDVTIDASGNYIKTGNNVYTIASAKFRRDWFTNPSYPATSGSTLQYFGVNWPIIRFSDVLLMFAEAENELNPLPTAAAYEAINEVRRRGFGKPTTVPNPSVDLPTGLSKLAFFDAIVNERAFEFGGEAIRKYDLIRWNNIDQKLKDARDNVKKMINKVAPYATLPQVVYYKLNSTADLTYYSSLYKPTVVPPVSTPAVWRNINWIASISVNYPNNIAELFKPNHSELLPLPVAVIIANPNIQQDCGCDN